MTVITETERLSAVGPYSLARVAGGMVYCSGQIGITKDKQLVPGGAEEEFKYLMENLKSVLSKAGVSLADVVKVVVFVTDMAVYPKINELYAGYFEEPFPARTFVAVAALPLGAAIEVEVVARIQ